MIKIDGVEVSDCEHFDRYWTKKCDGKYSCCASPNCEYKQRKRKEKQKVTNDKK